MSHTPDLIWRQDIITSIRVLNSPSGWQQVRGDVLVVRNREALSVHQVEEGCEFWVLSHVATGGRIVGFERRHEAQQVAEALASSEVPSWAWAETRGATPTGDRRSRVAKAIGKHLFPILDGRRVWLYGEWTDYRMPREAA